MYKINVGKVTPVKQVPTNTKQKYADFPNLLLDFSNNQKYKLLNKRK